MSLANATIATESFTVNIPEESLIELRTLIKLSKLPPPTYESSDPKFGVTHAWMKHATQYWADTFDWSVFILILVFQILIRRQNITRLIAHRRRLETRINSFPNFIAPVTDDDSKVYRIHYIGVISSNPDAVPIVLLHGWPSEFSYLSTLNNTLILILTPTLSSRLIP